MKIIAFPFAGGNKYSFNFLKKYIAPYNIELIVLEYPGRGVRMKESLLESIDAVLEDAFENLKKQIDADDYLIYGHSMGALIGLLVCDKLKGASFKMPKRLLTTGRPLPHRRKREKTFHLGNEAFYGKIAALGGIPEQLLQEPALMDFYAPILKADFKAVEEYTPLETLDIGIPISVLYGDEELEKLKENTLVGAQEEITQETVLKKWEAQTSKVVSIRMLKGNHFFIYDHEQYIAEHIIQGFS